MDLLMLMGDAVGRSTSLSCLICQVYYMASIQQCTRTVYSFHPVNASSLYKRVLQRIALSWWLLPRIQINPLLKTKARRRYSPFHCSPISARTLLLMKGLRLRLPDKSSVKMVSEALVEGYWEGTTKVLGWKNFSTVTFSTINVTLTGPGSIGDWN